MDLTNICQGVIAQPSALIMDEYVVLIVVIYMSITFPLKQVHHYNMNSRTPQASFFYKTKWIPLMDDMLLSTIIHKRNARSWEGLVVPPYVVRGVCKLINTRFGSDLTTSDIKTRLSLLKQRHVTFKALVNTTGVRWDFVNKYVEADEAIWQGVFQRTPFAAAYYHRDEPEFYQLATVFGLFDVKVEDAEEVINLSDTTDVIVLTDGVVQTEELREIGNPSPDADEVTSPPPGQAASVRRKLFVENHTTMDQISSTTSPPRFIQIDRVISSSPKGSSCASWSPLPTSRKTAP